MRGITDRKKDPREQQNLNGNSLNKIFLFSSQSFLSSSLTLWIDSPMWNKRIQLNGNHNIEWRWSITNITQRDTWRVTETEGNVTKRDNEKHDTHHHPHHDHHSHQHRTDTLLWRRQERQAEWHVSGHYHYWLHQELKGSQSLFIRPLGSKWSKTLIIFN